MIAVSNTTPLRYLIAIEEERLFPQLFEKVLVPSEVHEELTRTRTPDRVRRIVQSIPPWYEVRGIQNAAISFPSTLHKGEREAILLAEMLRSDFILIDDQVGRAVALARNLPVSGTLGVLERADTLGFVSDFPALLTKLKMNGFFISNSLEYEILLRHQARRGKS